MSICIITIRDTDTGVDIQSVEVADPSGALDTPAIVLGAAMVDNAQRYLSQQIERGAQQPAYTRH